MRRKKNAKLLFIVFALFGLLSVIAGVGWFTNAAFGAGGTRTVTIDVWVQSSTGDGIADVPVVLDASAGSCVGDTTASDGLAVLTASVPESDQVLGVRVSTGFEDVFPQANQGEINGRMRVALSGVCGASEYSVAMIPGVDTYSITIALEPCVSVSGRIQDGAGNDVEAGVIPQAVDAIGAMQVVTGNFDVLVPGDKASMILIVTDD